MSRYLVAVLFTLLSFACSRKPAEVAAPRAESKPVVRAAAVTAPAQSPRAELDALYKRASDKIDSWDGDGAVLDDARKDVLALLARDDQYAPGYAALARIEYRKGYIHGFEYEEDALIKARKLAMHAVKLDPSCFDCHQVLANIRAYSGDHDLAREEIARMRELRPGTADATQIEARVLIKERDYAGAKKAIREVLATPNLDPRIETTAWHDLAMLLDGEGFRADADEAYRKSIALEPESAWAHGNYAGFLLRGGEIDKSITEGERAVGIMPYGIAVSNLTKAYATKADELWREKRYDEAGKVIERATRLDPGNADAQAYLGQYFYVVFVRTSDQQYLRRSEDFFKKAIAIDPENETAKKALEQIRQQSQG